MAFYGTELRECRAVKISVAKIQLALASATKYKMIIMHPASTYLTFPDVVARTDLLGYTSPFFKTRDLHSSNEHLPMLSLCPKENVL